MSNKNTQVIAILDRSGSMHGIMQEAVGALNTFVNEQKASDDTDFTLVAFDNQFSVVIDKVEINDVQPITVDMVAPRGMTALYDAIGKAITQADQDRDTVLIIQTDGHENCSREWTKEGVSKLIEEKQALGWDISFVGAGLDQATVQKMSGGMSIDSAKSFAFSGDAEGMRNYSASMSATTNLYKQSKVDK